MELINIKNTSEFKDLILKEKSIVMIHKTYCPFCEKAMPWLREFSKETKTPIGEANKNNIKEVLDLFQVQMYPTFVAFEKGQVKDVFFGDTQYDKVKKFIQKNS